MTDEMTKAGMMAEARRQYERSKRRAEIARCAWTAIIAVGGVALLMAIAAMKRAERDGQAMLDHAHYEWVVATGGAR